MWKQHRTAIHYHDTWQLKIGGIDRDVGTPLEEFEIVLDQIETDAKRLERPVAVLASGGIDSELMIVALAQRTEVHAIHYKFMYDQRHLNEADTESVLLMPMVVSGADNIFLDVRTINLNAFWGSWWYRTFVNGSRCSSPQLPIHAFMTENLIREGFYPVLTEMQPELKVFDDGRVMFEEKEKDYAVSGFLRNFECCESPLQSTPEIMYSILTSEPFKKFAANPTSKDSAEFKRDQYYEMFGIDLNGREKLHGFEGFETIDNKYRQQIWDKHHYNDNRIFIPYDLLVENMASGFDTTYGLTDSHLGVVDYVRPGFNPI